LPHVDFSQPLDAPAVPLWAAAWYLSRVSLYRLLPLRWAMRLCRISRRMELLTHPSRRRHLEGVLAPLVAEGSSRRDVRRMTVHSKLVRRLGAHTYAAVFRRSRPWLLRTLRPEGLEALDRLKSDGRGAILLACHAGMNAWVGPVLLQLGYPTRLIQRSLVSMHEILLLRSDGWDSRVLPYPKGGDEGIHLKWLCDLVRQGEWVQHAADSRQVRGVAGRCLDRPVRWCRGPWAIARHTGAPCLPALILMDEDYRLRLVLGDPIYVDANGPPAEAMARGFQTYLDFLDRHVRPVPWNLHLGVWERLIVEKTADA
jgi:lauroyl/myristoyl acyltransferase